MILIRKCTQSCRKNSRRKDAETRCAGSKSHLWLEVGEHTPEQKIRPDPTGIRIQAFGGRSKSVHTKEKERKYYVYNYICRRSTLILEWSKFEAINYRKTWRKVQDEKLGSCIKNLRRYQCAKKQGNHSRPKRLRRKRSKKVQYGRL